MIARGYMACIINPHKFSRKFLSYYSTQTLLRIPYSVGANPTFLRYLRRYFLVFNTVTGKMLWYHVKLRKNAKKGIINCKKVVIKADKDFLIKSIIVHINFNYEKKCLKPFEHNRVIKTM